MYASYKKGDFAKKPNEVEVYGYESMEVFRKDVSECLEHLGIEPEGWDFIWDDDNVFVQDGNCGFIRFKTDKDAMMFKLAFRGP